MDVLLHTLLAATELPLVERFDGRPQNKSSPALLERRQPLPPFQLDRRHMYGPVITTISLDGSHCRFPGTQLVKHKKEENFPVLGLHGARSNFAIERLPSIQTVQTIPPMPFHHSQSAQPKRCAHVEPHLFPSRRN